VDIADDLRLRQDEQIIVPLEILGMLGEALAALIALCQAVALDHRAHRAVENHDPALEQGVELCVAIRHASRKSP